MLRRFNADTDLLKAKPAKRQHDHQVSGHPSMTCHWSIVSMNASRWPTTHSCSYMRQQPKGILHSASKGGPGGIDDGIDQRRRVALQGGRGLAHAKPAVPGSPRHQLLANLLRHDMTAIELNTVSHTETRTRLVTVSPHKGTAKLFQTRISRTSSLASPAQRGR